MSATITKVSDEQPDLKSIQEELDTIRQQMADGRIPGTKEFPDIATIRERVHALSHQLLGDDTAFAEDLRRLFQKKQHR